MKYRCAIVMLLLCFGVQRAALPGEEHAAHEVMEPGGQLPGESIYQLPMELTLQNGSHAPLQQLRGQPALVTMFYASCDGVCPLLAFTLRRVEAALPVSERDRLLVLMVSFDPTRDTPEALRAFAKLNQIDRANWLLARADENDVRNLAAVLGIRYRELADGVFSHSAVITLLDADGVIRAHTTQLKELDPDFMGAVRAALE
jgi:protein SCO1/2